MQTQMEISAPEISQKVSWDQSSPGGVEGKNQLWAGAELGGGKLGCLVVLVEV